MGVGGFSSIRIFPRCKFPACGVETYPERHVSLKLDRLVGRCMGRFSVMSYAPITSVEGFDPQKGPPRC